MAEKKEEPKKVEKPKINAKQQIQKAKLASKKARKGTHIHQANMSSESSRLDPRSLSESPKPK